MRVFLDSRISNCHSNAMLILGRITGCYLWILLDQLFIYNCESCPLSLKDCEICEIKVNESVVIKNCKNFDCENQNTKVLDEIEGDINNIFALNPQLKYITIDRAPLRNLAPEFCNLKQLLDIQLSKNCLGALPLGCFRNIRQIKSIWITNNLLRRLDKGTFDGLNTLESLRITGNSLESVDERAFSNETDLLSLKYLSLAENHLTSVGAWIFIRNLAVNNSNVVLRDNKISKFTNALNWTFSCKSRPKWKFDVRIDLNVNQIKRISDYIDPYFKTDNDLLCLSRSHGQSSCFISISSNPLLCDCVDYHFVTIVHSLSHSNVLSDAHCRKPNEYTDRKLLTVGLDEFICNITYLCPQGCYCIEQPSTSTHYVNCAGSYHIDRLPLTLPETKLKAYNLSFSGVSIGQLESREYFKKTKFLDLSGSKIKSISEEFFLSIKDIEIVYLHNNLIQSLPKNVCVNEKFSTKMLSLYNNPWNCNCNNKWLKQWMNDTKEMLIFSEGIHCSDPYWSNGSSIFQVKDADFCSDPNLKVRLQVFLNTFVPLVVVALLTTLIVVVVRKFRVEIHARFNIHPFDKDECNGEEMLYDVFLSSSFADRRFAINLVRCLEGKGYRVCYHEKDFLVGHAIVQNICRAITYSKRVACILTKDFIISPYCMYEFEAALHRNIEIKKNRLLVLLGDSVTITKEELPEEMFDFLTTHTYIDMKVNKWMDQLYYSLPSNKISDPMTQLSVGSGIELL